MVRRAYVWCYEFASRQSGLLLYTVAVYAGVYVCVCCVHTSPTVGGLVADCLYSDQNSNMHSLCRSNADTASIYGADCVFRFCFLPGVITGKDTSVRFSDSLLLVDRCIMFAC